MKKIVKHIRKVCELKAQKMLRIKSHMINKDKASSKKEDNFSKIIINFQNL